MKLSQLDLLRLLESPEYRDLERTFKTKEISAKELVCAPYDEANLAFIVKSGRLRVYLAYEDKEFTLALLEPGDIYSTHTRAFVQALEDSTVLVSDIVDIQQKIARYPAFTLAMVKVLGDLLKNSISTIEGLVFKDVRERLAEFLCRAAADKGRPAEDGLVVELGLTTEDIALLLGTTRQSVSSLLNEQIRAGVLVRLNRHTLLVKDLAALQRWQEATPSPQS